MWPTAAQSSSSTTRTESKPIRSEAHHHNTLTTTRLPNHPPSKVERSSRSWQVLIVEDDPLIRMMLQDMLVELGCAPVGPAGSVAAAFSLIASSPHLDGAVLDCNLGTEHVWSVAHQLTQRNVPFVFATRLWPIPDRAQICGYTGPTQALPANRAHPHAAAAPQKPRVTAELLLFSCTS
jgi:CheY-like chemotaxis protein